VATGDYPDLIKRTQHQPGASNASRQAACRFILGQAISIEDRMFRRSQSERLSAIGLLEVFGGKSGVVMLGANPWDASGEFCRI
jgi:hypothetical protein